VEKKGIFNKKAYMVSGNGKHHEKFIIKCELNSTYLCIKENFLYPCHSSISTS